MPYIAVEGCIASGKTTLAKAIAVKFQIIPVLEDYHDVPSLASFYKDPEIHAFETELQFTQSHFNRLSTALDQDEQTPFVTDFTLKRDLLFASVTLENQPENLSKYKDFWRGLSVQLPEPMKVILLEAPVHRLMSRIKQRGRPFEQEIKEEYLRRLVSGLREIYQGLHQDTLITLESADLSDLLEALPNNILSDKPET